MRKRVVPMLNYQHIKFIKVYRQRRETITVGFRRTGECIGNMKLGLAQIAAIL